MTDTTRARDAIRDAHARHRDVMGGMSMADLKLTAAAGLLRDDDPLPYAQDDPVWISDAAHGISRALEACDALRIALTKAGDEVARLDAEQARTGLSDAARCRVPLVHRDGSEARCVLRASHQRDDSDHVDEHGHTAPVLVTQATIEDARRVQALRDAGEIA
jgi:hypothetical protein